LAQAVAVESIHHQGTHDTKKGRHHLRAISLGVLGVLVMDTRLSAAARRRLARANKVLPPNPSAKTSSKLLSDQRKSVIAGQAEARGIPTPFRAPGAESIVWIFPYSLQMSDLGVLHPAPLATPVKSVAIRDDGHPVSLAGSPA
jgi:hypothetical protein